MRSSTEVLLGGIGNNYVVLKICYSRSARNRVPLFCCVQSNPSRWRCYAPLDEVTRGQSRSRHFLLPVLAFGLCSSAAAIEHISSLSQGYLRP